LAYILERHAGLANIADLKQKYQLSDWRMRPIPSEQLLYARTDTHFLLAIYDQLRAELAEKGDVEFVLDASKAICQQAYAKEELSTLLVGMLLRGKSLRILYLWKCKEGWPSFGIGETKSLGRKTKAWVSF
jgi:ribonuclease D